MKEVIKEAGLKTADLFERPMVVERYAQAQARLAEARRLKQDREALAAASTPRAPAPAPKARRTIAESDDSDDDSVIDLTAEPKEFKPDLKRLKASGAARQPGTGRILAAATGLDRPWAEAPGLKATRRAGGVLWRRAIHGCSRGLTIH